MHNFYSFFKLGFTNIAYWDIFGHILFIIALCGIYTIHSWKAVLKYVLMFFAGYLLAFLFTILNYIEIPYNIISYLIPLSILITAVSNFYHKKKPFINKYPSQNYRYILGFGGGIIHGFMLQKILPMYLSSPAAQPLHSFGFVLGIIAGLIVIAFLLLLVSFFITFFIRVNIREWNLLISGACAGISIYILVNLLKA